MRAEDRYFDADAILVFSFGGPEGEDEVVPFLENVTRGRGIPRERLRAVGEHYFRFGGVSPINRLNREIITNVRRELTRRGHDLPVYFGNRNWHPFGEAVVEEMARDGVRRAIVFATSAWGGYSGNLQYHEDIQRLREHLAENGLPPIEFVKLRQFYDHPALIDAIAQSVRAARADLPEGVRDTARMIFTAHSIPLAADASATKPGEEYLYSRQVAEATSLVAARAGEPEYDQVWQSRSGPPRVPWLEPDIVDHVEALHEAGGLTGAVVCPIGFISDHMEVIWDLDTELREKTDELGIPMVRSATVGNTPAFTGMIVDLVEELTQGREPERLGTLPVGMDEETYHRRAEDSGVEVRNEACGA